MAKWLGLSVVALAVLLVPSSAGSGRGLRSFDRLADPWFVPEPGAHVENRLRGIPLGDGQDDGGPAVFVLDVEHLREDQPGKDELSVRLLPDGRVQALDRRRGNRLAVGRIASTVLQHAVALRDDLLARGSASRELAWTTESVECGGEAGTSAVFRYAIGDPAKAVEPSPFFAVFANDGWCMTGRSVSNEDAAEAVALVKALYEQALAR
jgi:hypothetical protein